MNIILRSFLRRILAFLANWAIKKHKIELVVITGWYGSELAKELIYTILSDKYKVRRNSKKNWWDFSIPLNILGYKDKRRNYLQWMSLIVRATLYLLLGKSNQHTLIIGADCYDDQIASYWARFLKPNLLLILNQESVSPLVKRLIRNMRPDHDQIILNIDNTDDSLRRQISSYEIFSYGSSAKNQLQIISSTNKLMIRYKKQKLSFPNIVTFTYTPDIIGGVYAIAILKGLDIEEISFNAIKFELSNNIISTIKNNLKLTTLS